jgi:hypothetical protein
MRKINSDKMKNRRIRLVVIFFMAMALSCNEPETVVTNYVNPDGSVKRKIEMISTAKKNKDRFQLADLQVPFDSTWNVQDSTVINEKGDTTWIRRAERLFKNVEEINASYRSDSGANKDISRQAEFIRKFKWFNTVFRFSERIDKKMSFGYPVRNFLNEEELLFFYSPDKVRYEKENGSDSLRYKALNDTIKKKIDHWTIKNLVAEWIGIFSKLTEEKAGGDMAKKSLEAREDQFVNLVTVSEDKFDSLWSNGIILKEYLGEANYQKFKMDADTALKKVTNNLFVNFKEYSEGIAMPGKVIGTNGFRDSTEVLLWPVKSDFFMTEPYEMWAESKVPNKWAWIVSFLFLLFLISRIAFRRIRKADIHQPF